MGGGGGERDIYASLKNWFRLTAFMWNCSPVRMKAQTILHSAEKSIYAVVAVAAAVLHIAYWFSWYWSTVYTGLLAVWRNAVNSAQLMRNWQLMKKVYLLNLMLFLERKSQPMECYWIGYFTFYHTPVYSESDQFTNWCNLQSEHNLPWATVVQFTNYS